MLSREQRPWRRGWGGCKELGKQMQTPCGESGERGSGRKAVVTAEERGATAGPHGFASSPRERERLRGSWAEGGASGHGAQAVRVQGPFLGEPGAITQGRDTGGARSGLGEHWTARLTPGGAGTQRTEQGLAEQGWGHGDRTWGPQEARLRPSVLLTHQEAQENVADGKGDGAAILKKLGSSSKVRHKTTTQRAPEWPVG